MFAIHIIFQTNLLPHLPLHVAAAISRLIPITGGTGRVAHGGDKKLHRPDFFQELAPYGGIFV